MTRVGTIAVLLILVAAPLAQAAWGVQGAVEPDTPYDVGTLNHLEPDASADASVRKVYFNAIAMTPAATLSPNWGGPGIHQNQLPGMRLAPVGGLQVMAFLGVWKDCDGDGFVGKAATALWSYRRELLAGETACVEGTPWVVGDWVHEFVWITDDVGVKPLTYIFDRDAKVWGDFGVPGVAEEVGCRPYPVPRGTLASGGSMVGYVDCLQGRRIASTLRSADPDGSQGLAFDDSERPGADCDHALNEARVFGSPGCPGERAGVWEAGERRAFTVWDCDRELVNQTARDVPTGKGTTNVTVAAPQPAPAVDDPQGSYYEAANHAAAVPRCGQNLLVVTQPSAFGAIVGLESDRGDVVRGVKRDADIPTNFWGTNYGENGWISNAAFGVNLVCRNAPCPAEFVTEFNRLRKTPEHGGLHEPQHAFGQGGAWRGMLTHRAPSYSGNTVRGDLSPAGPLWLTFYARLGAATTQIATAPGGTGTYGAEACADETAGEHNGWDCETSNWWRPDLGGRAPPSGWAPVPGVDYRLRDVDCLDGDLLGVARVSAAPDQGCPAVSG